MLCRQPDQRDEVIEMGVRIRILLNDEHASQANVGQPTEREGIQSAKPGIYRERAPGICTACQMPH